MSARKQRDERPNARRAWRAPRGAGVGLLEPLSLAGLLALSSLACADFPDASTVTDLRVLAVQTDPSEVFLTVTGLPTDPSMTLDPQALGIDPASIRTIHVKPLLADPPAAAGAVTWTLSVCPNNPYGASPPGGMMGGGATNPGGGANTTVGSTLCDGARLVWQPLGTTAFAHDATADFQLTSEELLAAFKSDLFVDQYGQPHGGFDLGLPINVQLTVTDGVQTTKAVKRVVFWAHTWPDQTLNQIPALPGVSLFADRDEGTFELLKPMGTLDSTTPTHVARDKGAWLLPAYVPNDDACTVPDATNECYRPTVLERVPPYQAMESNQTVERIRYAFYATAGHFDPARTVDQLGPGIAGVVHLEAHYIPPATFEGLPVDGTGAPLVTVWVVVRDDRGGESWLTGRLALDP